MKKILCGVLLLVTLALASLPVSSGNPGCRLVLDRVFCQDSISY